tara:strand:- start:13374 stop:13700 length:327 start_codon:yes stop_codon:yes gene_type:complete
MVKCRIHIENDGGANDDKVYVDIELPAAPRVGEILFLSGKHQLSLEEMGKKDMKNLKVFYKKWFSGASEYKHIEENLKEFGFDDALLVSSVIYSSEENFMRIEITTDY